MASRVILLLFVLVASLALARSAHLDDDASTENLPSYSGLDDASPYASSFLSSLLGRMGKKKCRSFCYLRKYGLHIARRNCPNYSKVVACWKKIPGRKVRPFYKRGWKCDCKRSRHPLPRPHKPKKKMPKKPKKLAKKPKKHKKPKFVKPSKPMGRCKNIEESGRKGTKVIKANLKQTSGVFMVRYNFFSSVIKFVVEYQGKIIYSKPFTYGRGTAIVRYDGSSTVVTVKVIAPKYGSFWRMVVMCPRDIRTKY